jgi:hypothetical protein
MRVLKTGLGVRYNLELVSSPDEFTDSRDDFIHGIIEGRGGTCASLPVLFAALARRLGYPLKLVKTVRHLFCRWDDAAGERFNIEVSNGDGMDCHPDDYYRQWPVPHEQIPPQFTSGFLLSLSPREEVANAWAKRGHLLHSLGRLGESVSSFATAASLVTSDRLLDFVFWKVLNQRAEELERRSPSKLHLHEVGLESRRFWPGLPDEIERRILTLDLHERLLGQPSSDELKNVRHTID